MPEKRFKDIQGDDSRLRERYLRDHKQPPDSFVESAEGGGIDSREVEKQSATEEFAAVEKIETRLKTLRPGVFDKDKPLPW